MSTPETGIEESDPNADSREGLAGDMGLSSEREGTVRGGSEKVTYATAATYTDDPEDQSETPPEQSAHDGRPDVQPDAIEGHTSHPASNPRHGV